jgi:hypothetical protein
MVVGFKYLKKYKNLLRYTLLLAIALMMISIHKTSYYIIALLPFLVLIITLSVQYIFQEKQIPHYAARRVSAKTRKEILAFLLLIYLCTQLVYIVPIAFTKYDNTQNRQLSEKYIGKDTDSLNIVAPMKFVYNEIGHYKRIHGEICYNELKKLDSTIYQQGFLAKTNAFDVDYIILMDNYVGHFGMDKMSEDEIKQANFDLIHRDEDLVVLRNRHND